MILIASYENPMRICNLLQFFFGPIIYIAFSRKRLLKRIAFSRSQQKYVARKTQRFYYVCHKRIGVPRNPVSVGQMKYCCENDIQF